MPGSSSAVPRSLSAAGILIGLALAASAGIVKPAADPSPPAFPTPPSILLVTLDTLRADHVGCYGARGAETPNLDALAREGVRFDEARSHVPLTLPSHATILTGLLPPRHGVRANGLFKLGPDIPTLAAALHERGYRTAAVVASVVLDRAYGLDRGFDLYDDNQHVGEREAFDYEERGSSQIAEAVEKEIPALAPPFFLWAHFYDPHAPYVAPSPYRERHASSPYDAEVAFSDAGLGRVLRAARERAGGNLIVAVLSDHGESLGEHGENQHGYTLHRGVLRVPLILAGPGIPRGRAITATVGLVDVAPTLAALGGASLPGTDGSSLIPYWTPRGNTKASDAPESPSAGPAAIRQEATDENPLWEETLHPLYDSGWAPLRGLLTSRWHFVEAPRPEIYDRRQDPSDRRDIAKSRPEIIGGLRSSLAAFRASLKDGEDPALPGDETPEERERREKLASLGYMTGGAALPVRGRLDPKDGLPGFLAVETAGGLIEKGRGREAAAMVEPFTRKDPTNPRIWHQLGRALGAAGDLAGAEHALRRAADLDPRGEFIRYALAELLSRMGDPAGARGQYETILAADPRATNACLELASLAAGAGDLKTAETSLRRCYDAGARDPDLLDRLGALLLSARRPDEAAPMFAESLKLNPAGAVALLESGRAALRAGDANGAIELLGRCRNGGRAFECRMEMARAYVVGPGNLAAARALLVSAAEVAPDEARREEIMKRLEAIDRMESGTGR